MSDLKDRLLEEKLIVILRGLAEEKLIATVDILKNMGMHFFELAIDCLLYTSPSPRDRG